MFTGRPLADDPTLAVVQSHTTAVALRSYLSGQVATQRDSLHAASLLEVALRPSPPDEGLDIVRNTATAVEVAVRNAEFELEPALPQRVTHVDNQIMIRPELVIAQVYGAG